LKAILISKTTTNPEPIWRRDLRSSSILWKRT
jgi:hypothetical protein